jgi:hypothetical protein
MKKALNYDILNKFIKKSVLLTKWFWVDNFSISVYSQSIVTWKLHKILVCMRNKVFEI